MNLLKSSFIAVNLCALLSLSLSAQTFDIENKSLIEAIKEISKTANIPYLANSTLLENKKAPNIKNIEGLENALEKVLEGTNLEAVIEDGTIIIKERNNQSVNKSSSDLGNLNIIATNNTEDSGSYTIDAMNTSTRLNLSIKDTPQSISVITNQKIQDLKLESFEDVLDSTAGISMTNAYETSRQIYSRGFRVDYYQIDGIPTVYEESNQEDLVIYDRVEIVKGANGLISGAGEPAASINYVRKNAKSKDFQGSVELEAGSWNTYGARIDLASGLNEDGSIRGRLIASYKENDSFIDSYNQDKNTLYAAFEADLSDNTLLSVNLSKQKFNDYKSPGSGIPIYFTDGSRTDLSSSSNFGGDTAYHDFETTSASVKIEHIFNNNIKLSANYMKKKNTIDELRFWNRNNFPDKDTGEYTIESPWTDLFTSETDAVDIYASVPFMLANRKHELITGLMYSENIYSNLFSVTTGEKLTSNVYDWDDTSTSQPFIDFIDVHSETKQFGFYSVGKFSLADDLKLIAGARVSNWKYNYALDRVPFSIYTEDDYTFNNNITPFLGLIYDLNEQHSVYTSYTSIFKPQTDIQDKDGNRLDPKEGSSYEIGFKSSFFDDLLTSSVSLFRIEQENLGVADGANVVVNTNDQAYKLADGVVSKGIEINLSGEINDNWNVDFALSHYEAKDSDGEKLKDDEPLSQVNLSSKYILGKLSLGAGVNWQSEFYEIATNPATGVEDKISQESYYVVNMMAKLDIKDDLSIQGNLNNLFDKKYYSDINYRTRYRYGDPRNITLTLKYTF